jgi:Ras GTPase-activating-like protein IQGAP2/3
VDGIVKSLDKLPYGLRWLMKQLRDLCLKALPDTTEDDISKVIVYFVYYRFINLAIVQPDAYKIANDDLPPIARKNLITVSRVLQNLFNFRKFNKDTPGETPFVPLNDFIDKNAPMVQEYVAAIYQVPEPEDKLQVNRYMELAQKAKPVIIISLHEIYKTHALLSENLSQLVTENDDPLKVVMADLGPPPTEFHEDDQDRELQLTLTNRFKVDVDEDSENQRLYAETKELVIPILRLVPVQNSIHRLSLMDVLESGIKFATETNNGQLKLQIKKILENLGKLEAADVVSKDDNYDSFVHDVAIEVANRATIREQQRKEVARLKATLAELKDHQAYLDESIQDYNDYLQVCKERQYSMAGKKKKGKRRKSQDGSYKVAPIKFTYKDLAKKRVIVDSEVPTLARKKTVFMISSETPGVFDVDAKIGGVSVEKMVLDFDDLLEKHYNNVTQLELEQVTLDVNMTIHLINKSFLS